MPHRLVPQIKALSLIAYNRRNAYKGASSPRVGILLAPLRFSKVAAKKLPSSGQIYNPSPRFNGLQKIKKEQTTKRKFSYVNDNDAKNSRGKGGA